MSRDLIRWCLPLALAAVLGGGCATYTAMQPAERAAVERELSGGEVRFLRLSYFVTPFFGDASKKLLTAVPPEEVRLLNHPNGAPVNPGPSEKIIPAGTRARVVKVEFPTGWAMAERVAYTPRHLPWIYLEVEGEKDTVFVLPLEGPLDTPARFFAELERYLTAQDPERLMKDWGEEVRAAVRGKTTVPRMPPEAVRMALGYPERIRVHFEGAVKREEWIYPGEQRIAVIADGEFVRVDTAPKK